MVPVASRLSENMEHISLTVFFAILFIQYFKNISDGFVYKYRKIYDDTVEEMSKLEEVYEMCLYDLSHILFIMIKDFETGD